MVDENQPDRLSQIPTLWSMVRQANEPEATAKSAQEQLLDRYGGAVKRYLLGAVRDDAVANELFQDFALRFIRGDFQSANPDRGQFRSFLKTILYRMVADHYRSAKKDKLQVGIELPEPSQTDELDDESFAEAWRDELLSRTWGCLEEEEKKSGKPYSTIMKLRLNNPTMRSADLAEKLTEFSDKSVSRSNARVILHRARERFADHLIGEVAHSLKQPTMEQLEDELADLGLLDYCRPSLAKWQN